MRGLVIIFGLIIFSLESFGEESTIKSAEFTFVMSEHLSKGNRLEISLLNKAEIAEKKEGVRINISKTETQLIVNIKNSTVEKFFSIITVLFTTLIIIKLLSFIMRIFSRIMVLHMPIQHSK